MFMKILIVYLTDDVGLHNTEFVRISHNESHFFLLSPTAAVEPRESQA
jgi:hypothetical protein